MEFRRHCREFEIVFEGLWRRYRFVLGDFVGFMVFYIGSEGGLGRFWGNFKKFQRIFRDFFTKFVYLIPLKPPDDLNSYR